METLHEILQGSYSKTKGVLLYGRHDVAAVLARINLFSGRDGQNGLERAEHRAKGRSNSMHREVGS